MSLIRSPVLDMRFTFEVPVVALSPGVDQIFNDSGKVCHATTNTSIAFGIETRIEVIVFIFHVPPFFTNSFNSLFGCLFIHSSLFLT